MVPTGGRIARASLRLRPCRLATIAAFALVAGSAVRAEATCGDYLAHSPAHIGQMPGDVTHEAGSDSDPTPPMAPCDGPLCRRRDQGTPQPPAPYRPADSAERWCRLPEATAARPVSSSRLSPEDAPSPVGGDPLRVERPPRG